MPSPRASLGASFADDLRSADDAGLRDFKLGTTGLLTAAGLAILFAIIF
jgi:hypothetical protein